VFARKLMTVSGGAAEMELEHYQVAFEPLLYGVVLALLFILVLRETGPAKARPDPATARSAT
jgi:hypothetical protein